MCTFEGEWSEGSARDFSRAIGGAGWRAAHQGPAAPANRTLLRQRLEPSGRDLGRPYQSPSTDRELGLSLELVGKPAGVWPHQRSKRRPGFGIPAEWLKHGGSGNISDLIIVKSCDHVL